MQRNRGEVAFEAAVSVQEATRHIPG